jgi:hypothetical protein
MRRVQTINLANVGRGPRYDPWGPTLNLRIFTVAGAARHNTVAGASNDLPIGFALDTGVVSTSRECALHYGQAH